MPEALTITSSSTPPLRPGTYYISLALFRPGKPATGSIVAVVDGGIFSQPSGDATVLTSGVPMTYSLPGVPTPALFAGASDLGRRPSHRPAREPPEQRARRDAVCQAREAAGGGKRAAWPPT